MDILAAHAAAGCSTRVAERVLPCFPEQSRLVSTLEMPQLVCCVEENTFFSLLTF